MMSATRLAFSSVKHIPVDQKVISYSSAASSQMVNRSISLTSNFYGCCKEFSVAPHAAGNLSERKTSVSSVVCSQLKDGWITRHPAINLSLRSERSMQRSAVADSASTSSPAVQTYSEAEAREWVWTYEGKQIKVHYVVHKASTGGGDEKAVFLPAISDVSTVEEFSAVARAVVEGAPGVGQAVVVDWPGFGYSDRPVLEYKEAILESFLADFLGTTGPLSGAVPIIVGAGHAGTIAARAVGAGRVNARAIATVAPTWAGPLPIVFGKGETMEGRYGLFRNILLAPLLGSAIYKYTVASPKNIRMQYLTHVYADPDNLSNALVEARAELPKKDNARFGPAAFLTGQLDPASTRDEFLALFAALEDKGVPALVLKSAKSPRRSRAEMDALQGAKGVTKFVEVRGALLPHEEYADDVTNEILAFLQDL